VTRRLGPFRLWHLATIAILVIVVLIGVNALAPDPGPPEAFDPICTVIGGAAIYELNLEQAAHATTIAAIGKRLGMPDHAVSVALATALQESKLHNVDYGDRDSVGLFQQRPSQGWGTPSQLVTPTFAATAFYNRLAEVDGWETMSVTDAAQRVQRSGAPNAYAKWEPQARATAQALTGQVPAGFSCKLKLPTAAAPTEKLGERMSKELGLTTLATTLPENRGWTVASWMVGHAEALRILTVTFGGQKWTADSGRWAPSTPAESRVRIQRTPAAASAP
jgi:hypothetical protein